MKLKDRLLYALFPARCTVCDKVLYPGETMCADCEKLTLHYPVSKAACERCGMERADCPCGKRLVYSESAVPFFYEKDVKKAIQRMKFRGRLDLVKPFAEKTYTALKERDMLKDKDIITFIPMHGRALFDRGYNQSRLLAEELGKLAKLPVKPLLYKVSYARKQHSLGYLHRSGNIIGSFEPLPKQTELIKGKNILVVDDIITTGSTLNEAAKTLLIFGAEDVSVAAAAQVRKKKSKNAQKA